MHRQSLLALMAFFLVTILICSSAGAEDSNDTMAGTDISRQIDWIQSSLDAGGNSAKRWQYGWCTIYGGLTYLYAGQALILDDSDQEDDRYDAIVNSAASLAGFAGTLAFPMKTHIAAKTLRSMPESTEAEKRAKLQRAETLLRESAEREAFGRSWQAHAAGAVISVLAGAAVALDDGRDGRGTDSLVMFAANLLVSEIQIFTTPTRATKDWERYQQGRPMKSAVSKSGFFISAFPQGIRVHYLF